MSRRRSVLLDQADAARAAAGDAFVELDRVQRDVEGQLGLAEQLDARTGAGLRAAYAPVAARVDGVVRAYLDALDSHEPGPDTPAHVVRSGIAVLAHVSAGLQAGRADLAAYAGANAAAFAQVNRALAAVGPKVVAAQRDLAAARAERDAAAAAGLSSPDADRRLAAAEESGRALARGAAATGLAEASRLADRAAADAAAVRALVAGLPAERDRAARDVASVRTRADVVDRRMEAVPGALSALRRGFAAACFADVEAAAAAAPGRAAEARERLARAAGALAAGRHGEAAADAAAARAALAAADAAAAAVPERLALLQRAAADPGEVARPAWFAVRDAQRLVLAQAAPDRAWVARLDAAALELRAAEEGLAAGPHPDYGRFLRALDRATASAADVVASVRARTHPHR